MSHAHRLSYGASGQALIEMIVVIGVVVLLTTGLVAGATMSLKSGQFGHSKSQASKYAEEGIEISRKLRDSGWTAFQNYSNNPGPTWCLLKDSTWVGGACTSDQYIDGTFSRTVLFSWDQATEKMTVTATVSWVEGLSTHTSELTTYFTNWR